MLQNLYMTFSVVFPFVAYLLIGMLLRRMGILDEHTSGKMNRFVALLLFPVNLFNAIYKSDVAAMIRLPLVPYIVGGTVVSMLFLVFITKRLEPDPARQCAMAHCGFRSNATLFALAMSEGIFGELVPEIALVLGLMALINNVLSIPLLEHFQRKTLRARGESEEKTKTSLLPLLKGWITNPLLVGTLLGVVWSVFAIPMPEIGAKLAANLSAPAIPIAFIMLGSRLDPEHLRHNSRGVVLTVFYKLILLPVAAMLFPLLAGWSPANLVAVLTAFGTPAAVITYVTTMQYDGDGEMAGEIISVSTVLSMFTIFLFLFVLKQAGFI